MNVITHRVYKLEMDVWEPIQEEADKEINTLVESLSRLSHCGRVRLHLESEERQNG